MRMTVQGYRDGPHRPPLRYGTDACCLVSSDESYTKDIVALRNDPQVNRFIHHGSLTDDDHERWLEAQQVRRDSFNFVSLVNGRFAGTASLYDVECSTRAQYGRVVMPQDERRIFAVAVEYLCLSFAFDILCLREVYCRVARENRAVWEFHLRNGWNSNPLYDASGPGGCEEFNLGMSMSATQWEGTHKALNPILSRLLGAAPRRG